MNCSAWWILISQRERSAGRQSGRRGPVLGRVSQVLGVGVLGVVHAVGELRAALRRTRVRMLALSTTLEPALLKRVKNFSCRDKGKDGTTDFPLSVYRAGGGLRQAPGRAA